MGESGGEDSKDEKPKVDAYGRLKGVTLVKPIVYGNTARYLSRKLELGSRLDLSRVSAADTPDEDDEKRGPAKNLRGAEFTVGAWSAQDVLLFHSILLLQTDRS